MPSGKEKNPGEILRVQLLNSLPGQLNIDWANPQFMVYNSIWNPGIPMALSSTPFSSGMFLSLPVLSYSTPSGHLEPLFALFVKHSFPSTYAVSMAIVFSWLLYFSLWSRHPLH